MALGNSREYKGTIMNKKSFILSLVLSGSILAPQSLHGGPWGLVVFTLWGVGVVTTTTVTTGYVIKGHVQKYNRARNFVPKQSDIKEYQAALTILPRVKNTKKFNEPLAQVTFSDTNYETVIEQVESFLKELGETQFEKLNKNTLLKFVIETAVTLQDEKIHKLKTRKIDKKLYLSTTLTSYDKARITKILNNQFYIPKSNIRYKKKAFLGFFGTIALITGGAFFIA